MTSSWTDSAAIGIVLDRVGESPEAIAASAQRFVEALQTRLGALPWQVVDGPSWSGTPADLAEIVRARPSTAATGFADATDGYGFTLYTRREPIVLSVGVDVGGPRIGRRLPAQNVHGRVLDAQGGSVDPALGDAMLEALIEGWQPLFASLSDADVNIAAGRGRWKIPAGYRVWLRDGTVTLDWLAEGVTSRPFAGGTMISVPDDWPPDQIAQRLAETYERNGVDVVPH